MTKRNWTKKRKLFDINKGSNSYPHNYQTNAQPSSQFMFLDILSTFILMTPCHVFMHAHKLKDHTNGIHRTQT